MPGFLSATCRSPASVIFQQSNRTKDFNFPSAFAVTFKRASSVSWKLKGGSTTTCCHRKESPAIASLNSLHTLWNAKSSRNWRYDSTKKRAPWGPVWSADRLALAASPEGLLADEEGVGDGKGALGLAIVGRECSIGWRRECRLEGLDVETDAIKWAVESKCERRRWNHWDKSRIAATFWHVRFMNG